MAPFGFLKKKKVGEQPKKRESDPVFARVKELSERGFSEPEVFKTLKKEGFKSLDIDKAIRHNIRSEVGLPMPKPESREGPIMKPKKIAPTHTEIEAEIDEDSIPKLPELPELREKLEEEPMDVAPPSRVSRPLHIPPPKRIVRSLPHDHTEKESHMGKKEAEELIEIVVSDKLSQFTEKIASLDNRFKEYDSEIKELNRKIDKINNEKETEIQKISKKIDDYKDSMEGINSRMDAIKTALKQTLLNVTDKVEKLDNTLDILKDKHKDDE